MGIAVLGAVCLVVTGWAVFFRHHGAPKVEAERPPPRCASARLPGRLGEVAWSTGGRLQVLDLDRCALRTVAHDAAPPVQFSPDGRWIAFGEGAVVPARGGEVRHPLGELSTWDWSPDGDRLAGVTRSGRVLIGGMQGRPVTLIRGGAVRAVFSPNGRDLAVDRGRRVAVLPTEGGATRTLFTAPREDTAAVIGWATGGNWVLFFVHHPGRSSDAFDAAPLFGGGYHNVFDPVLPHDDFLSWCGDTLVVSGGGARYPSEGQQLLVSAPPRWRTHNLSADFRTSWIWPSCSPNGRWIAVTVTPNRVERPPGEGRRSVWVVSADGRTRRRLAGGPNRAYETPRWSADGRTVMVVERGRARGAPGSIVLIRIDPKTGKPVKTVGPIASLGPAQQERGYTSWSSTSDWYRP